MANELKSTLVVVLLALTMIPLSVSAETSGGIQASSSTLSILPASPEAGDSITIFLTLYNSQQIDAFDVEYAFYKDGVSSNKLLEMNTVHILGESTVDVNATWNSLTEGTHKVWVTFEANGDTEASFYLEFVVTGLPNLRVVESVLSPLSGINSGDNVTASTRITNTGSVDAAASTLHFSSSSGEEQFLPTPAILAGQSQWVNTTFIAPESGTHTIYLNPDYYEEVHEASEINKIVEQSLLVETRMDVYHIGDLTVTVESGALEGPWTIEGTLGRTNGTGTTEVPLRLEIPTDNGGLLSMAPFTVSLTGIGYAETSWSQVLTINDLSSLSEGSHIVTAQLDPFNAGSIIQETTDNDRASGQLSIYPIPDIFVDGDAIPSSSSISSGEDVTWRVSISNIGDIQVRGRIVYVWEGVQGQSDWIYVDAGATQPWDIALTTLIGSHTAEFEAQWVPHSTSWDSNPLNSLATGSILVEAPLRLQWVYSSISLTDISGNAATAPLQSGDAYTLSINMTSIETGNVSFNCVDGGGDLLETMLVTIEERGDRASISCNFVASAPISTIKISPSDMTVTSMFTRAFPTATADDGATNNEASTKGTMTLLGGGALGLVALLVVAFILTREREEEVERDIFDYCPSCDGELEGDEDRCPHCAFNLKKARKQFHDCHECTESIPDLMEDCPYCGAKQDVSSFFEQRQRRVVEEKEYIHIEIEEDEDEIVTGAEDFASTAQEFGYDEEQLEQEWDENLKSAEEEVEAAYDRRHADEIALEGLTEEEIEELKSKVTTTLKSAKEAAVGVGIDEMLEGRELQAHLDDGKELSASDAGIREQIFQVTGEDGVLPGEKVEVGMSATDNSLAGNEVIESKTDFTFEDDDAPLSASTKSDSEVAAARQAQKPKRRAPKRKEESSQVAECGACGADIAVEANECGTCGAKFE
ncbi:MAG TPA: hypothetical protein EYQ58_00190 [Candidatus Poseidoniales archaeon]|nr:hypothetical protein [Candidatus Poseidoniales archaeon]